MPSVFFPGREWKEKKTGSFGQSFSGGRGLSQHDIILPPSLSHPGPVETPPHTFSSWCLFSFRAWGWSQRTASFCSIIPWRFERLSSYKIMVTCQHYLKCLLLCTIKSTRLGLGAAGIELSCVTFFASPICRPNINTYLEACEIVITTERAQNANFSHTVIYIENGCVLLENDLCFVNFHMKTGPFVK